MHPHAFRAAVELDFNIPTLVPYWWTLEPTRKVENRYFPAAFEILVVRAPGTTKKVNGQPKILMRLSDGQP